MFESAWKPILAVLQEAVLILNPSFELVHANHAAKRLLGASIQECIAQNVFALLKLTYEQNGVDCRDVLFEMQKNHISKRTITASIYNRNREHFPIKLTILHTRSNEEPFSLVLQDISHENSIEQDLLKKATLDELTGLPNRRHFTSELHQMIAENPTLEHRFSILFIDLDGFKDVNDSLGHKYGDILLQSVSERFKRCLRESDLLARLGGDEFVILLRNTPKGETAFEIGERLLESLTQPFNLLGVEAHMGASIGIAGFPEDGQNADHVLKNADAAMYHAKGCGKNNVQFYTPELTQHAAKKLKLTAEIPKALQLNELQLHYQLQFGEERHITGVEALLRWYHPEHGFVPPAEFIALAEESGQLEHLEFWAMEQAISQMKIWHQHGIPIPKLGLNLSSRQFSAQLLDHVLLNLDKCDLEASCLELELTESLFSTRDNQNMEQLKILQDTGVMIALDHFGTGFSSFVNLATLPISTIKIDQCFVHGLEDTRNQVIIKTIVGIGESLQKRVVAQGVETELQRTLLKEMGCKEMQGYLLHRPMPAHKITSLYKKKMLGS